jgi:tRNA(fMet)-specific endonuclease VapC
VTVRYLLDTDTCSYVIRNRPESARQRMNAVPLDQQGISVVTYAELLYGVRRSSSKRINRRVVDAFVRHLFILDWNREAAECYAEIRTTLERKGKPIGGMDMLIAAHALSLNAVVVTNNARHFGEVPNLAVENWTHENP